MNRLMLLTALGAGLALAGCEYPSSQQTETAPPLVEAPVAPAATDQATPAADTTAATDQPPADNTTLPPESRSSEQTVQPESETLFY
jgi:hypothetical protein